MKRKPRKIAPGKPLDTPAEELDLLAIVTPEDIELAKAAARQRMKPRGVALLAADRVEQETDGPLSLGT